MLINQYEQIIDERHKRHTKDTKNNEIHIDAEWYMNDNIRQQQIDE